MSQVNSPAPGTPQTKTKAYVALAVSLIGAVGTALLGIFATDSAAGQVITVVVALATALGTAFGVAQTANRPV